MDFFKIFVADFFFLKSRKFSITSYITIVLYESKFSIINNLLPISVSSYNYHHTQFHTRQHQRDHFILLQDTLNTYKYSFYPRTIKDWNNLPINVIEARDINEFTYSITVITSLCMYVCAVADFPVQNLKS